MGLLRDYEPSDETFLSTILQPEDSLEARGVHPAGEDGDQPDPRAAQLLPVVQSIFLFFFSLLKVLKNC